MEASKQRVVLYSIASKVRVVIETNEFKRL